VEWRVASPRRMRWRGPLPAATCAADEHRYHTCEILASPLAWEARLSRCDGVPKTFWSSSEIRGWPITDGQFLTHEIVLHNKKFVTWNAPLSCIKQAVAYLFVSFGRSTSPQWPPSLATPCLPDDSQNCQKFGAAAFDLWSQFRSWQHVSASVLCVGDYCIRLISSVPTGRNLESSGPAAVHENAVRRSLARYILHWFIVSEHILKWSDIISFSPGDGDVASRGCWSLTGHPLRSPNDFINRHIQGVPGGMCQTSGGCSLC